MDILCTLYKLDRKFAYILVIVDQVSKITCPSSLKSTSAELIADAFLKD